MAEQFIKKKKHLKHSVFLMKIADSGLLLLWLGPGIRALNHQRYLHELHNRFQTFPVISILYGVTIIFLGAQRKEGLTLLSALTDPQRGRVPSLSLVS